MKNLKSYIIIALIIVALVLVKVFFFSKSTPPAPKGNPAAKPANVEVEIVKPSLVDHDIFVAGSILGNESVELQPEAQGKITGIYFSEGQSVTKGQLLVKLNDAELQAQLKKAEAQSKIAEEKSDRLRKLLAINGVSREEFDVSLNEFQSLEADIEALKAKIAETEIRAPFNGIIGLRAISLGSFVGPGTRIATLEQLDQVKLDLNIPEKYSNLVKIGDLLTFTVEGRDSKFNGRVYAIDPRIDPATRSLKLRALCANPAGQLKAGAFAKVALSLLTASHALMVPTEAIVPDMQGSKVFVVQNGLSQPRTVQTGLRTEDRIEITNGLKEGDSVIVTGVLQVKPNNKVNVLNGK